MCNQNITQNHEEEIKQETMEHDAAGAQEANTISIGQHAAEGMTGAYQKIEEGVVSGYKKIEDAVVGGYKRIEEGVVDGFTKMTDKFVEKLFAREGESVEDAKKRLNRENQ